MFVWSLAEGGQDTAALSEVTLVFCGDLGLSEVYSSRLSKVLQPSGSYSLTVILPTGKLRLWSSLETLQRIAPQPNRVGVYVYAFFCFFFFFYMFTFADRVKCRTAFRGRVRSAAQARAESWDGMGGLDVA